MKAMQRNVLLAACAVAVVVAAVAAAVFATGGTEDAEEPSWDLNDSRAAARVGDTTITEGEVTAAVRDVYEGLGALGLEDWLSYLEGRQTTAMEFREQQLNRLVYAEVMRQAAERVGVEVTDDEVRAELEANRKSFLDDDPSSDPEEAWESALRLNGYSESSYEDFLHTGLIEEALATKIGWGEPFSSWLDDFESSLDIERMPAPDDLPYLPQALQEGSASD